MDDQKSGINRPRNPKYRKYLSPLLTGPGGMGKIHAVKEIQQVLEAYGRGNNICFFGTIWCLINHMIIHKGLFIKVRKKGMGKGN